MNSSDALAFAHAVGFYLRARRIDLRWSIAQLAQKTGLAESTLSRTERGLLPVNMARLCELCGALGVPPAGVVTLAQKRSLPFGWRPSSSTSDEPPSDEPPGEDQCLNSTSSQ